MTGVTITDTVPANTTFVSATGGGTESGGVVTWNIGTLQAGAAQQCVNMTVLVDTPLPQGVTTIDNTQCTIDSNETPPTTKTFSVDVCKGGIPLTMDCNSTPALPGKQHSVIIALVGSGDVYKRQVEGKFTCFLDKNENPFERVTYLVGRVMK